MRTAIFDLDGTLADTSADLVAAANAALGALGLPPQLDPDSDALTAFHGGRAMLRLAMKRLGRGGDEEMVERGYPLLLQAYEGALDVHTTLYPGAAEALARLAAAGWSLGVCTNKPVAMAQVLLERLGIARRFAAVLGADSLEVRKPDPRHLTETVRRAGGRVDAAVLIGDTDTDRQAARAAGMPCVLVTFGPSGQGVRSLAPDGVLDHFDRIEGVLDGLVPRSATRGAG